MSRFGLVTCGVVIAVGAILVDATISGKPSGPTSLESIPFNIVTHDGRQVGRIEHGQHALVLSPLRWYDNQPEQPLAGINAHGFRGPQLDMPRIRRRIFIQGGSTVFGLGVKEPQSFAGVLRAKFPDFEIVNAGVIGYGSSQEVSQFATVLASLEPAMIISVNGWNDLYDKYFVNEYLRIASAPHYGVNSDFLTVEDRLVRLRMAEEDAFVGLSLFVTTVARRSTILSVFRRGHDSLCPPPFVFDPNARSTRDWMNMCREKYVSNMVSLGRFCDGMRIPHVVMIQPECGSVLQGCPWAHMQERDGYGANFPGIYSEFAIESFRELSSSINGSRKVLDSGVGMKSRDATQKDFLDPVHLSESGHLMIAEMLALVIRENLVEN